MDIMRIICPECFAQFDVPDGAIKETGRKLRCGQCKHQWHQLPIPDEPPEIIKPPTEEPEISETYNEFETPPIPEKRDIKAIANIKTKSLPIGNNSLYKGFPFWVDFFATVNEPFINPAL